GGGRGLLRGRRRGRAKRDGAGLARGGDGGVGQGRDGGQGRLLGGGGALGHVPADHRGDHQEAAADDPGALARALVLDPDRVAQRLGLGGRLALVTGGGGLVVQTQRLGVGA